MNEINERETDIMRRYEYLKLQKRCVRCGNRDERTMSGRVLCSECTDYALQRYPEHRGYILAQQKQICAEREKSGLCYRCGAPLSDCNFKTCEPCRERQRRYQKSKKTRERIKENGTD